MQMEFILFLTLNGIKIDTFGPHVDDINNDTRVEHYKSDMQLDDAALFLDDIDDIDRKCNSLLDYGDVEWFDAKQCKKLLEWINERLKKPIIPRYEKLLCVLKDFCSRAIELNTGVIIDL